LCGEQQHPGTNEMHPVAGRWTHCRPPTERAVGHVSWTCPQVQLRYDTIDDLRWITSCQFNLAHEQKEN